MALDYTIWPTVTDVTATLSAANITLGAGVSADMKTRALNAAISKITQKTGREFLATASVTRNYDGNGTGEIIIDDYVSISDVSFYALPMQPAVAIANFYQVTNAPYAKNRIQIYQGPANSPIGYFGRFPQGRSNIAVTGIFGWASIPAEIWEAVCQEAAGRLADQARMTAQGIFTGVKDLDQDFTFSPLQIKMLAGWQQDVKDAIKAFKRSTRDVLIRETPILI